MSDKAEAFLRRFGANLERCMESRGVSAAELAELSGLRQRRIERILAAQVEPGAIEILQLAAALKVLPEDLFKGLDLDDEGEG